MSPSPGSGATLATTLSGHFYLFGFDEIPDGATSGGINDLVCAQGHDDDTFTLFPTGWGSYTRLLTVGFTTDYDTTTDDDYATRVAWDTDEETCTSTFLSQDRFGNSGSDLRYQGCQLMFPDDIRIEEWEFTAYSGSTTTHSFTVDPDAAQVWLPIVSAYESNRDDDFGYETDCAMVDSETLECSVTGFDGNSGSYVAGRVVLLENPDSF